MSAGGVARKMECLVTGRVKGPVRVVHGVRTADLGELTALVGETGARFAVDTGFTAASGQLTLVPDASGEVTALLGLPSADRTDPFVFGGLARGLPKGDWTVSLPDDVDRGVAVLGFALGAYRYALGETKPLQVRLYEKKPDPLALEMAQSIWLGRDLINAPANLLGPEELAAEAQTALEPFGAKVKIIKGKTLEAAYPLVAHVGNGSERRPRVVVAHWVGSQAKKDAPLLSLVGKGVCFDSGGYDIKPSSGMLRMKKDMGGAATVLALARLIMARDLPLRLELRLGCVENSVSGTAMRPLDVVTARNGLTVEIGNTDAEGRLVLADLLTEASEARPAALIDVATLTGAARVALGPDLPVVFGNDDTMVEGLLDAGKAVSDPFWRLPLWDGYRDWLRSSVADLNNISSKPFAGAITAALFLERFVESDVHWAHIDSYAWNDSTRRGRPEGGEILGLRAIYEALPRVLGMTDLLNS
ncbi:leucyl aminopeptidase family protein [Acetobacter sp.]|uniref:leucyl aminopeptidase family protein n=1 Tax=Acetobacter sp. TaxID=440 RepID=UPI0025C07A14|nr:leucyl aminopeptidase family protein [Acetobacter sp.]MCH4092265.1 leucyl aminopeptidase family protein [Acetobacter sp.]MCI1299818.1 leucyl aminopeptidase family protein [Acetobacter sp.]MCI1315836.1 leucyl aminopeptidase family protein [Acetobacter sp.]